MDIHDIRRVNYRRLLAEKFDNMPSRLADKLKISRATLSRIFSSNKEARRNIGNNMARDIEQAARKPRGWLDMPHDDILSKVSVRYAPLHTWYTAISVVNGRPARVSVHNQQNGREPGDLTKMLCPVDAGPKVYCLRVEGNANRSPQDGLVANDLIFVDPDREPIPNKFVVVQLPGAKGAILRRLIMDGGQRYLQADNPEWPDRTLPWPDKATYCGLVLAKVVDL